MGEQTIHRGIRKMVVAPWEDTDTYGTTYPIRGARNMSIELVVETDELRGDDVVLDRFTKIIAVTANVEIATVDLELFSIVMGGTYTAAGVGVDYEDFVFGGEDDTPYVGLAGRIVGSGAEADLHIFIPKAKVSSNFNLAAQVDTYMTPSATFQGVDDAGALYNLRNFNEPTALEIPLRTEVGGFA